MWAILKIIYVYFDFYFYFIFICRIAHILVLCGSLLILGRPDPTASKHCDALQRSATHCTALQHVATHCNMLQRTTPHCDALQHGTHGKL